MKLENKDITIESITKPIAFIRNKINSIGFINTFWLKIIAIVCMTIDHIGLCLGLDYHGSYSLSGFMSLDTYNLCRMIGRLAFPIFCYLIVEGLIYTKSTFNYCLRLFIFAFISQVPFSLMTRGVPFDIYKHLNVYFTLALGLITIAAIDYCKAQEKRGIIKKPIFVLLSAVAIICTTSFADSIQTDYAGFGVLVIVIFYIFRDRPLLTYIALYLATYYMSTNSQMYSLWAMVPILLHNHKKGPSMKYFFYVYYPAHMLILYFISTWI